MTTTDHVYIVTTTDSDGDTWIVDACDTLDTAQYARLMYAERFVLDGLYPDVESAIDSRRIRIAYHKIETRDDITNYYS